MGQAYTATLSSTTAILQALRKARKVQQGISAEQRPDITWAEPLPQYTQHSPMQNARSLHLSPNGIYCIAEFMNMRSRSDRRWPWYGVALYETHTGRLLHTLRKHDVQLCDKSAVYQIIWAPCSTMLFLHQPNSWWIHVYDADSGSCTTIRWEPDDSRGYTVHLSCPEWAPDFSLMMRKVRIRPHASEQSDSWIDIVRGADGSMVASIKLQIHFYDSLDAYSGSLGNRDWMWHSLSPGAAISHCSK